MSGGAFLQRGSRGSVALIDVLRDRWAALSVWPEMEAELRDELRDARGGASLRSLYGRTTEKALARLVAGPADDWEAGELWRILRDSLQTICRERGVPAGSIEPLCAALERRLSRRPVPGSFGQRVAARA